MGFKLTKKKTKRKKRNKIVMHLNNFLSQNLNAYNTAFCRLFSAASIFRHWPSFGHILALFHCLTWLKQDLLMVIKLQRKWWNLWIYSIGVFQKYCSSGYTGAKGRYSKSSTSDNLTSTSKYRTIANLFGVSTSFVCTCIKDVCKAITRRTA